MTRSERDDRQDTREASSEQALSERESMDLALTAYVEDLARGRAVLFFGEPESPAAERLGTFTRQLEVFPAGARHRPSRSGVGLLRSRAERPADLIWLSEASSLVSDAALLREIQEALSPTGAALFVFGADASYEGSHRALTACFDEVRMLGQAPFVGQSIVDFQAASKDESLFFDGSIVGDEPGRPARFVALCGGAARSVEPHAIVQLPPSVSESTVELRRDRDATRARLEHAERRLEQAQREVARAGQKLDVLRHEIANKPDPSPALEGLRREYDERLREESARVAELSKRLAAAEARDRAASEAASAIEAAKAAEAEVRALEERLRDRAREVLTLEAEVARRGVLVRDLVEERRSLEVSRAAAPEAPGVRADAEAALREALVGAQRRAVDAEASRAAALFARDEATALAERTRRSLEEALADKTRSLEEAVADKTRSLEEALADKARQLEAALACPSAEGDTVPLADLEARLAASEAAAQAAREVAREGAESAREALAQREAAAQAARAEAESLRHALAQSEAAAQAARAEAESLRHALAQSEAAAQAARAEAATATQASTEEASARGAAQAALEGELAGLRFRVADLEASRAALTAQAQAASALERERASLEERLARLASSHDASLELQQMTASRADAEAARSLELAQRVLALDALTARLQSTLASEMEKASSVQRAARETEARAREAIESRDAAEAVATMRAEADHAAAEERSTRLDALERSLASSRDSSRLLGEAARDVRAALVEAVGRIGGPLAPGSVSAPSADGPGTDERDAASRAQIEAMRTELEDREILLRSLTAQLEDRDERLRALEGDEGERAAQIDRLRSDIEARLADGSAAGALAEPLGALLLLLRNPQ